MARARRRRATIRREPVRELGGAAREHWRDDGAPKTQYGSADDANRAALQAKLERGADVDPYVCSFCGSWHLGTRRE